MTLVLEASLPQSLCFLVSDISLSSSLHVVFSFGCPVPLYLCASVLLSGFSSSVGPTVSPSLRADDPSWVRSQFLGPPVTGPRLI